MLRKPLIAVFVILSVAGLYSVWHQSVLQNGKLPQNAKLADASSITVTDLAGRQVTLKQPIQRIVLMRSLCMYELAAVMDDEVEQKLVGWDSSLKTGDLDAYEKFTRRFPRLKDAAVLGDVLKDTVSAEKVLALNPDIVIMGTYMKAGGAKGLEQLEQAGIPLLYLDFDDPFRDPRRSLLLLGKVLGKEDRVKSITNWIDTEFNKVFTRLEEIEGAIPSIYLEAGTHGAGKYGNTFGSNEQHQKVNWGSVLSQLHCRNIAADTVSGLYGMGVIQPELLLTSDPDVIVITGANWTAFPDSLRLGYHANAKDARKVLSGFCSRPGWANLKAVKNGRVYGIHTRFGSHITSFAAAQQLAKWLYPKEFESLDPEAALREFHEKFMPIEYSGTWMIGLGDE